MTTLSQSKQATPQRIAVLPPAVADQIAAGEVVERPASVVKELVENALDAGATSIEVSAEDGGKQRIRVSDDGSGMSHDDALLALERHATSKIRSAADLVGVPTYGFRGEAIPAICSVSQFEIETSFADGAGTRVIAAGGSVRSVEPVARRRGTTVNVARLFYNAPARQKFLRGARSEWRSVVDVMTTVALTRRDIRLTLAHEGREAMALAPASSLRDRISALWGADYAARFVAVDDVSGPIHVSGLVERPADVGTGSRRAHISVNGRPIRDVGVVRSAEAAYRSVIPSGIRPSLFLEIVLPGDAVDINVHPTKAEVRFRDRWSVERAAENAVRRALGTTESAASIGAGAWVQRTWQPAPVVERDILQPRTDGMEFGSDPNLDGKTGVNTGFETGVKAGGKTDVSNDDIPELTQLHRTYMLFESEDGIVLIDQHSAHERVLYEEFMAAFEGGQLPSQRLLFPLTLSLSPAESEALEQHRDALQSLGYELGEFGGQSVIVHAVPHPHPRFDAERCLRDSLTALTGDREPAGAARHQHLAATVACKAAIKAGDRLAGEEMRALFVALRECQLPAHDVHGRSTIVYLSWNELERRFGRR